MKIALVYPPTCDPTAPYLAVPMLTGFLRANGVEVLPIDANVEAYDALLRRAPLEALRERLERRVARLEERASLDHGEQLEYVALWRARGDAHAVPDGIDEAVAILRDPVRFFDGEQYARAVDTIDAALRVISAAHAPLQLDFTAYRTPFALTTPEEIARDATPERDPFDDYVVERARAAAARRGRPTSSGCRCASPGSCSPPTRSASSCGARCRTCTSRSAGRPSRRCSSACAGQRSRGARAVRHGGRLRGRAHAAGPVSRARRARRARRCRARAPRHPEPRPARSPAGREFTPGEASEDMRALPPPDFDGLPLDKYFSPRPHPALRSDARLLLGQVHVLSLRARRGRHRQLPRARRRRPASSTWRRCRPSTARGTSISRRTRSRRRRSSSWPARSPTPASSCAGPPTSSPRGT